MWLSSPESLVHSSQLCSFPLRQICMILLGIEFPGLKIFKGCDVIDNTTGPTTSGDPVLSPLWIPQWPALCLTK